VADVAGAEASHDQRQIERRQDGGHGRALSHTSAVNGSDVKESHLYVVRRPTKYERRKGPSTAGKPILEKTSNNTSWLSNRKN
jgi:hypothetical protein